MTMVFGSIMGGGNTTWIMLALIIVIVVVMIVSSIRKRKQDKIEKEKRQKEVRNKIKQFLKENEKIANKIVEFDKVVSRTGKDYKYRDVFDVVVKLYESKDNSLYAIKAFEVEGFSKQITKKQYETTWHVNHELVLKETLERIKTEEKKSYWKMTKAERAEAKLEKKSQQAKNKSKAKKSHPAKKKDKIKQTNDKVKKSRQKELVVKKQPLVKFGAKN